MPHRYSMAYLTGNGADPVAAVRLAAACGYDMVSFRLLPAADEPLADLMGDDRLVAEVKAAMADTGVTMADAEMIRLKPDTDLARFDPFLDRIALLGAKHILVAVDDADEARATDAYGNLCRRVEPYGFSADLEFMPWTGVKDIRSARRMVEAAASPSAAILFDTLHFDRSSSTLEDLAALPASMMNYVQFCDGLVPYDPSDAGMIHIARQARLAPGDGGIDFAPIVARLPEGITISVEVPNRPQADAMGRENFIRMVLDKTKAVAGDA
ncbi:hypothetical protein CSC94_13445 [Zhengella mangrovi]|uniref:Xylose isomerase-like TIM barrel domain-containing protein n=1 Tax=Zhengella mangrovi TaxID=1982044 RepID=A0A2G1QMH7_9HYPH|nr:TIM barrel protein [Zhengella mangrovi]PHP66679.1 hypothetical protein CSC94_13445 [Zhengella mangrovi]